MLSVQDNEKLTRVGPGTAMGTVFRRYWLPALLSSELPEPDGAPKRLRLLGEDLVAFRDSSGLVGILDAYCPHRRAPLFLGRNENCGLRCVYHGWKFDAEGKCVDVPTEPKDSRFKDNVRITAYPAFEGGGMIWTYMGPKESMPAPPDMELIRAPATHRFVSRTVQDCNYLQALEGGLDAAHAQILHNINIGDLSWLEDYARITPRLDVSLTDYGFNYRGIRIADNRYWVRLYHYIMPVMQLRGRIVPVRGKNFRVPAICGHAWVPSDDVTCSVFNFMYSADPEIPMDADYAAELERDDGRAPDDLLSDLRLKANLSNDFFIDRQLQKTKTFTGIHGVNSQDVAVQEGMGPIADRSKEHLGSTDRAVIALRRLLLEAVKAVEAGEAPRGAHATSYRNVRAVDHFAPIIRDEKGQSAIESVIAREQVARF